MGMNNTFGRYQKFGLLLALVAVFVSACGGGGAAPGPTAIPQDVLRVSFVYGSEKKDWVNAVTTDFNNEKRKTPGGKVIFVEGLALGSTESVTEVVQGKLTPALWSPASSLIVPIMNDQWFNLKQKAFIDEASEPCKQGVVSPVVIAMWKPMAQALGWPDKQIGWSDIAKISTSPNGWADYGQPQLGKFRFGHTHPDFSNSGLSTIVAMAYAASNPGRRLTVEDVQKPETGQFLRDLESAISHYGSSTGFFGDAMIQRGPTYLSAAVVYESIVASSYDANGVQKNPDFPLVAIYPKEGTFLSDHPLCIPDAPWMTDDLRAAAKIYRDFLLSKPAQERALQFGFRPSDPNIPISKPISIEFGVDPKQPQNVLQSPDIKTIDAVRALWEQQKRLVNLSLVIDISGSMKGDNKIAGAREGAKAFVDLLDEKDTLTVIVFDDKQDVLFDAVNVGQNRAAIKQKLDLLIPRGGTALFDSIGVAFDNLKTDPTRINAIVVMTDGQDTDSSRYRNANSLMDAITGNREGTKAPDVSVFTIGYGRDADGGVLSTIAKRGGGKFASGNTDDIQAVFRDIATFF
jgi:Ca-activated chloride channel homolog